MDIDYAAQFVAHTDYVDARLAEPLAGQGQRFSRSTRPTDPLRLGRWLDRCLR